MRTTILLDDELAENLKKAARDRGLSFSAFIAEAGRAALRTMDAKDDKPFELLVDGKSGPLPGVDLNKTSELLAAEDQETYGK